ncbi:MAG: zinc ribbon domain-containing protein, partial [Thermoflexus sp.]
SALNVALRREGDKLIVEVGAGKWVDKAVAAGAGVFILWPLLFTAAYGAWQQSQLPKRTFEFIQHFIATGAAMPVDTAAWSAQRYQEAKRYVSSFEAAASPAPAPSGEASTPSSVSAYRFCPSCGAELPSGARFCPACGAKIGA